MGLRKCQVKKEEPRLLFLCLGNELITLPMFTKEDKCQISKKFSLKSRYIQENDRNTSEMISPHWPETSKAMTVLCRGDVKGQQGRELGKICTAITYICVCKFKIGSRFKTILKSESKLHNMPHKVLHNFSDFTKVLVSNLLSEK